MSDLDKNKLSPERLTLSGVRNALFFSCCLVALLTVMGLVELKQGNRMYAGWFCLVALGQLFNVPQMWKNYRQVKQGIDVYVPAQAATAPLTPVPRTISVTVVLVLSGFVGIGSIVVLLAVHICFNTPAGWLAAVGILSFLWLITAYCWYSILSEKPRLPAVPVHEQREGVWPPPPSASDQDQK